MRALCVVLFVLLLGGCAAPIVSAPSTATRAPSPRATLVPTSSPSPAPMSTPLRLTPRQLSGDLLNQITRVEVEMPRAGSQGFVTPTDGEKTAFAEIVVNVEAGEIDRAAGQAAENNYELVQYADRGDANSSSWMLRELKPIRKGWGLYAVRANSARDVIVEAPHPLFDESTPAIAAQIYRALQGRALLIAGAHRHANADGSADVSHQSQTIFEAIHESLTKSDRTLILQVHGFASSKHAGYPQVILSTDEARATKWVARLAEALRAAGAHVGVCDGRSWTELCGEKNLQSRHVGPAIFIHLELDETMRANPKAVLKALQQVLP